METLAYYLVINSFFQIDWYNKILIILWFNVKFGRSIEYFQKIDLICNFEVCVILQRLFNVCASVLQIPSKSKRLYPKLLNAVNVRPKVMLYLKPYKLKYWKVSIFIWENDSLYHLSSKTHSNHVFLKILVKILNEYSKIIKKPAEGGLFSSSSIRSFLSIVSLIQKILPL